MMATERETSHACTQKKRKQQRKRKGEDNENINKDKNIRKLRQ